MARSLPNALLSAAAGMAALMAGQPGRAAQPPAVTATYKHVLLISVDGMHAVDLTKWIEAHPASTFAKLAKQGVSYSNAFTTAPSDSFPGMIAQATGASPKTAGLFYDDSFDRTAFPAGSKCVGNPGAELTNFEALDRNLDDITGGGTLGNPRSQIDPAHLQLRKVGGACVPVWPHQYLRTNTIFEVIKSTGLTTAWSDKHPAYEILNGPSGRGIDDLYTPEINAQDTFDAGAQPGDDYTTSFTGVRTYDSLKVQAVLNWIDGYNSVRTVRATVPAIFGMNFQAVSVGQKLAKSGNADHDKSLVGGYLDGNATPGNALTEQLQFVDNALGRMVRELATQGLDKTTLVIVSSKHGQSPIDVKDRVALDDSPYQAIPGYGFHIADDVALIWLAPALQAADYNLAETYLLQHATELGIAQVLDRRSLSPLYGDPFRNSRVPDFIALPNHGVIYTGGSKLAEHGGFSSDDRNVALLVYAPGLRPSVSEALTYTTQIAPTILSALGIDPNALKGVQKEGTPVLTR